MRSPSFLLITLGLIGCGDDQPTLTDATSLTCPRPGDLPFRLESSGFLSGENETLAGNYTRVKDEASDTIGNPGGAIATMYLLDNESPTTAPVTYRGAKARTDPTRGLFTTPLPGEFVSLWTYDTEWRQLARGKTDDAGFYEFPDTGFVAPNGTPVYAMLEADGDCMDHYTYLLPPGSKVVVTDIDGTLTLDDDQQFLQFADENYVPIQMGAAVDLINAWSDKGYPIIYLTARFHAYRNETRAWLRDQGFPLGPMITELSLGGTAAYKTAWINRIKQTFGWNVVVAYGNADTDIEAYEAAGIPKAQTFIVGPLAGDSGTQPIANMDYAAHIATYVSAQPNNN